MMAFFSELDGTTFMKEVDPRFLTPYVYAPIMPSLESCMAEGLIHPRLMRWRRYALVGVSDNVAFYDRVVDVNEIT